MRNAVLFRAIQHVLGGRLAPELQAIDIVRQAADWVSGAHTWLFLNRPLRLSLRGVVTIANATYAHATRTLTLASAFEDYEHVPGDRLEAQDGTDVVFPKSYPIESRTSDNAIVLGGDGLGADADTSADIDARIPCDSIALPSDFMAFVGADPIWATDSIVRGVHLVTHEQLSRRRTANVEVDSSWFFQAAYTEMIDLVTGTSVPVLELHPPASSGLPDAFQAYYRARITIDEASEQGVIPIPANRPLIEQLLTMAVREIALGYEEGSEDDKASMYDRLDRLLVSSLFEKAKRQDGLAQPTVGPLGGGVGRWRRGYRRSLATPVDGPA